MPQTDMILQPGTNNKTVKLFANLNRSRTFREKNSAFAMEGYRLVSDALRSGVKLRALLLTEKADAQYGAQLRQEAGTAHVLLLSAQLAGEIADTETAQGVFAIAEMLPETDAMPQPGEKAMLLHCVQDPNNLGAVLRTAEALGTDGLYLFQCCDLYNPKVIRSTMGSIFRVPCFLADLPSVIRELQKKGTSVYATSLSATRSFREADLRDAGIIIGSEASGISKEVLSIALEHIKIPMAGRVESLNAAMASGILMYEAARQRRG